MKTAVMYTLCLATMLFCFFVVPASTCPLSHSQDDLQRRHLGLLHDIIDGAGDEEVPQGSAASGAPNDKLRGLVSAFGHG